MPVPSRITDLSGTAADNYPSGSENVGPNLDNYLRGIQAAVAGDLSAKGADIASATTTDLGAVQGLMHDITGTTTITGLGTVRAGIWKILKFEGALTLTHNATSLILPGASNITTADGDVGIFISEGSGNWRCLAFAGKNAYFNSVKSTGQVTGAAGGGAGTISMAGLLSSQINQSGVGNTATTSDVDLFTYTMPAGTLNNTGRKIRVKCWGTTGATGNNKTIKGWFAGVNFFFANVVTYNNVDWTAEFTVTYEDATHVTTEGKLIYNGQAITVSCSNNSVVENLTSNTSIVKFTGASGTTGAANDIVAYGMSVELLN